MAYTFPFYPPPPSALPNSPKNEKKTPGDIIILHKCIKIMIICFTVPEILWVMDVIAIFHFRLFFALLPPNSLKNENFKKKKKKKKWKKRLEISSFYICVAKINSNLSSPKALSPNTWKKPENFWKSIPKKEIKVKKKSNWKIAAIHTNMTFTYNFSQHLQISCLKN